MGNIVKLFNKHKHQWKVAGVENLLRGIVWLDDDKMSPVTEILYRCSECLDVKTTTLDGHWTLEQVKGNS